MYHFIFCKYLENIWSDYRIIFACDKNVWLDATVHCSSVNYSYVIYKKLNNNISQVLKWLINLYSNYMKHQMQQLISPFKFIPSKTN